MANDTLGDVLTRLYDTLNARKDADPKTSYTAKLLQGGPAQCAKKFGEEAIETVIAGSQSDRVALCEEAADTLYHLLVLMVSVDATPGDIARVLANREGVSGHEEKASRK